MMGRMQRNKGAGGEREFAAELTWVLDCSAHRGRQYHGGEDAPDIKTTLEGVHFEVKRTEALSLYPAMEQAIDDGGEDSVPVVAHRRSNKDWLLVVRLQDLPAFLQALKDRMYD